MYSPSPTVRSSPVPMYLRGAEGLGDLTDPTYMDVGSELTPPDFTDYQPLILVPSSAGDVSYEPYSSVLTPPTFAPITQPLQLSPSGFNAAGAAAGTTSLANQLKTLLSPGPSPRVTTPKLTSANPLAQNSVIAGMAIPNLALLGVGALILLGATRK